MTGALELQLRLIQFRSSGAVRRHGRRSQRDTAAHSRRAPVVYLQGRRQPASAETQPGAIRDDRVHRGEHQHADRGVGGGGDGGGARRRGR